ncbi:MAG: hypothetical protein HFH68_05810 [Lachnospiraceae bacterium]|nr:hypothetical protein [Lachnospiraceae bacterium]
MNDYMIVTKEKADCNKYAGMDGLKELVFHDCHIENLSELVKMPNLKTLGFARCTFGNELLPVLEGAPGLARINLHNMDASGLEELRGVENLKRLYLNNVTGFKLENLTRCENIFTLEIDDSGWYDSDIISRFVNLKKLCLYHGTIDNLDFLKVLPKLHKFLLPEPAGNEDGLTAISSLENLKEFIYPVKDLSVYKDCGKIEKIGIASSGVHGFEALEGSRVNGFTVCGSARRSSKYLNEISEKMQKYIKRPYSCSYGYI